MSDELERYPPHVLREYALIADGRRGAVCGPRGDICWLCSPSWHDDAVFSTLIGGSGLYAVTPVGPFVWGGYYEQGSLVWRHRWVGQGWVVECRDALAQPADDHRVVVLRRIMPISGDPRATVTLHTRHGFGADPMRDAHRDDRGVWTIRSGALNIRWQGMPDATVQPDGSLTGVLDLPAGTQHDLVLEIGDRSLPDPPDAAETWRTTERVWGIGTDLTHTVAARDARHAVAVLRGLTAPSGAMVAATTMSLPERAEHGRNFDYRYAWIRDQCYTGIAAADAGVWMLLDDAVRFVSQRLLTDGPKLQPAYRIDCGPVPDERRLHLPGYPGGRDIAGNHVNAQFQLDNCGEALQLLSAAARHDRLDAAGWRAAETARDIVARRWDEPEAGVWELDDEWWTQSRLSCVAGLRSAARVAPRNQAGSFDELADRVLAATVRRCRRDDGAWKRAPDRDDLDAALLLPPVRGGLPHDDTAATATLAAVRRDLATDHYVYRYHAGDQPLGQAEGAFLLCGFIVALALHQQGEVAEAFRYFERTRASCGPPGLFAEEYDVEQRQLRGNLPQAFVHAALLEAATRLAR